MPESAKTTLAVLNVTGHLKFMDDANVGNVSLAAQFIFVHGRLTIGSPTQHFRSGPQPPRACFHPL
jgi:G8 domain